MYNINILLFIYVLLFFKYSMDTDASFATKASQESGKISRVYAEWHDYLQVINLFFIINLHFKLYCLKIYAIRILFLIFRRWGLKNLRML